ncbi:MAG: hypothetical protein JJE53_03490 [Candidatus Pacebacteria bacterium]|nr:hypothetical protein [Candidatus Paceibacterota bacterium]
MKYKSTTSWQPQDSEFKYDRNLLIKEGFFLVASYDKRNPDKNLNKIDLENEGYEVREVENDEVYVHLWKRKR